MDEKEKYRKIPLLLVYDSYSINQLIILNYVLCLVCDSIKIYNFLTITSWFYFEYRTADIYIIKFKENRERKKRKESFWKIRVLK